MIRHGFTGDRATPAPSLSAAMEAEAPAAGQYPAPWREPLRGSWGALVLLLLAAGVRLPGLFLYPYEQDELYTVIEATDLFHSPLKPGIHARPLYYILHHAVIGFLPQTHAGLRLPAFLFGLVGVALTWGVGRRLFGRTAGLVAAAMVAISPWHMHASGMARYWSMLYVLALLFYFFLFTACGGNRPRDYVRALACLVLGTLTHPTFAFPAAGLALATSVVRTDGRLSWRLPSRSALAFLWGPFALMAILALGVLAATGNQTQVRNFEGRGVLAMLRLLPAMVQWMTPTIFASGLLGGALCLFDSAPARRRWGVIALAGSATAMILLMVASSITDVYADYGMAMLPLFFLSSGALVQWMTDREPAGGRAISWVLTGILSAGVLPSTISHLSDGTRFDYRPAFRQIAATAPQLPVLTWPIILQQTYAPQLKGREVHMTRPFLTAQLAQERDLWVVLPVQRYGIVGDDSGEVGPWLRSNCRLTASHERPRLDYRVYRVDVYRCQAVP
jgi:hypothetical protein